MEETTLRRLNGTGRRGTKRPRPSHNPERCAQMYAVRNDAADRRPALAALQQKNKKPGCTSGAQTTTTATAIATTSTCCVPCGSAAAKTYVYAAKKKKKTHYCAARRARAAAAAVALALLSTLGSAMGLPSSPAPAQHQHQQQQSSLLENIAAAATTTTTRTTTSRLCSPADNARAYVTTFPTDSGGGHGGAGGSGVSNRGDGGAHGAGVLGARVLAQSLRSAGAKGDVVVLVPLDKATGANVDSLRRDGLTVHIVPRGLQSGECVIIICVRERYYKYRERDKSLRSNSWPVAEPSKA